ncbi:MAG: YciI family protein [Algoriphagus sp.]|uniref:YciI family protein n=1 Tax=Algoriphagus sp. TaxID=1872435 RepID=UPI002630A21E|nr:YciI family protein [Algoriphagus sp.]MDG1278586.1 YciI family protein [Algoriphagus sp.]
MKNFLLLLFILLSSTLICNAQKPYDPELAKQLGADEYGMKKYVIAFLYRGDRTAEYSAEERAEFQKGHLANITRLATEGKLVLAGPFFGNEELRGLFFFNVETVAEAESLTESDPSIQAGILKMEMKEWYGSAALPLLMEWQSKIAKEDI